MKFCPNCGYPLEGKKICNCGYNVETNEVDEKVYEKYKENEKKLYEQQCDNMINAPIDMITGARLMGLNPNVTDDELLKNVNRPIFNKENDHLTSSDFAEMMKLLNDKKEK